MSTDNTQEIKIISVTTFKDTVTIRTSDGKARKISAREWHNIQKQAEAVKQPAPAPAQELPAITLPVVEKVGEEKVEL